MGLTADWMMENKELVNLRTNDGNDSHPWNREKGLATPRQRGTASGVTSVTGSERERRERRGQRKENNLHKCPEIGEEH